MDTTQSLVLIRMLTGAARERATDLHINGGSVPMMRIDGTLRPLPGEEIVTQEFIGQMLESFLSPEVLEKLAETKDYSFTHLFDNKVRAKVSIYYEEGAPAISMRLLDVKVKTLQELNTPDSVKALAHLSSGLVLIAGTYGSGRTTLAMALLEEINRTRTVHVMTVERPIEYDLAGNKSIVDQREVGDDVATFEDALTHVQREDVDVVFVSELTTANQIMRVLEIATSGVLVFAIVDSASGVHAIEKILAALPPAEQEHARSLLSQCLEGVVAQRLVPRIGGGMVAVHEVIRTHPTIQAFIAGNRLAQISLFLKNNQDAGMANMEKELANLVRNKEILPQSAHDAAVDKEFLSHLISG
ncbi:MAG: ATPase, T2SS/T4P/T4SS family [bacterium]|nr:ATPase, T2SS/T4P/T4SS family [bacterium]